MFERYTEKARRAVFFARYEASEFGSSFIEAEHLLLGILREDKPLVNRLFRSVAAFESIRKEIEGNTEIREKVPTSVDMPLTNECKRALAYAAEEAERLAHQQIAAGHLLLGLMREEKCFAAQLLRDRKLEIEQVREEVRQLAGEVTAPPERTQLEHVSLSEFGADLTHQAENGELPPLIGRELEMQRVIQVLSRLTGNNPLLVGEQGVGKKTLVYGLAQRIAEGAVSNMAGRSIVSLDLEVIGSGTRSRVRFEENLEHIVLELLHERPGPIFFMDGLHALAQKERFLSVANVIKPALMDGSIQCISTATPAEHAKTVEAARWLEEYFTVVEIKPPSEAEAIQVLVGVKDRFQKFHQVTYTEEAIRYAVFHSNSYFPNCYLPEKAIDLIDEAGARVKLRQSTLPLEMRDVQKQIKLFDFRQANAINNHEFSKARFYEDELKKVRENLKALGEKYRIDSIATVSVTREDVEQIVAERTGCSLESLRQSRAIS